MSFLQNLKNRFIKYVPDKERKAYPNLLYISALGVTGSIITRKSNALVRTVTPISLMLAGSYVWYPQTSKNVALAINNRMKSLIQKKQLTNSLNSTRDVVEGKFNSASKVFKKSTDEVKSRVNKVQKDAKKEINKAQKEVKGKVDKAQKQIKKEVEKTQKNIKKEVEKTQKELKNKIEKAKK
ncbi:hypothetical protein H8356DRAFT_1697511 [Neocallimastix lanati (nom. inval.)]|nr:hypothetical protein H8356DRAFT_1697511 [Neocallimastix sp. JGI-2020a]